MKTIRILAVILLSFSGARADQLELVRDINQTANSFYRPADMTVLGPSILFTVQDVKHGKELWRLDAYSITPTPSNQVPQPVLVKDIHPGPGSAFPEFYSSADTEPFEVSGGRMFFKANDGEHGFELWATDGKEEGTLLIKDINPGAADAFSTVTDAEFTPLGGAVYFIADDGANGQELWRTDGTAPGTYLVADVRPGAAASAPRFLTVMNGALYFSAEDGVHGRELWKTDGTEAGTMLVADVRPGPFGGIRGDISEFEALGDQLFFTSPGDTSTFDMELWVSDGTATGTHRVTDLNPSASSYPVELFSNGDRLYFWATDGTTGRELWKTDGTEANTILVKDIRPGSEGAISSQTEMIAVNKTLYFFAHSGGFDTNEQLWKSDGTEAGTVLVADLNGFVYDFDGATLLAVPDYSQFGVHPYRVYFTASDGLTGQELWVTKGVPGSEVLVADLNAGPADSLPTDLVNLRNRIFFSAYTEEAGNQIYTVTPSSQVARRSDFVNQNNSAYHVDVTEAIVGFKERALFFARQSNDDIGLYITDGTEEGTIPLKNDVLPADILAQPILNVTAFENPYGVWVALFGAINAASGYEPWVTDGKPESTKLLDDIYPGPGGSLDDQARFEVVNGRAFFVAADPEHGSELWVSDGTDFGTHLVKDIWPGPTQGWISEYKPAGDLLFFEAEDGVHGSELWRSDGTEAGTFLIDLVPGPGNSFPGNFRAWKDRCLFTAETPAFGGEPWISDGKAAGTYMIKDIAPGSSHSFAGGYTALEKYALFRASDGATGIELWRTDGTSAGTELVKDIQPGPGSSFPFVVAGENAEVALLGADDGTHGDELWRSDGSTAGTILLKDIYPGSGSSYANYFAFFSSKRAVFSAYDEVAGNELWFTDFTTAGTRLVKDIYYGLNSGISYPITEVVEGTAYFYANDGVHGFEIWRYRPRFAEPVPVPLGGKPVEQMKMAVEP